MESDERMLFSQIPLDRDVLRKVISWLHPYHDEQEFD